MDPTQQACHPISPRLPPTPHTLIPRCPGALTLVSCLTIPCTFYASATPPTSPIETDHHVNISSTLTPPPLPMSLQLFVSFPTPWTLMLFPSSSSVLLDSPTSHMSSVAQLPSHGETEKTKQPTPLPEVPPCLYSFAFPMANPGTLSPKFTLGNQGVHWAYLQSNG